jgi:hypothetical protein
MHDSIINYIERREYCQLIRDYLRGARPVKRDDLTEGNLMVPLEYLKTGNCH